MRASDGTTEEIQLLVNGAPLLVYDLVTGLDSSPDLDTRDRLPVGTDDVVITQEHRGWSGSLPIADGHEGFESFRQAYTDGLRAKVKPDVVLIHTITYPATGTSTGWLYPDLTLEGMDRSMSRGSDSTNTWSWRTGKQRIPQT